MRKSEEYVVYFYYTEPPLIIFCFKGRITIFRKLKNISRNKILFRKLQEALFF